MRKSLIVCAVVFLGVFVFAQTAPAVESVFHGQFRLNSYWEDRSDEDKFGDEDTVQATRLRWRPTWDVAFDSGVKMHLQFTVGHTKSNLGLSRFDNGGDPIMALRHAYIMAPIPFAEPWNIVAGLVPWDDKFDQTLFSSDWDFNPLAYALVGNPGGLDVRIAHANAVEGDENVGDDFHAWIVDADHESGFGVSYYYFEDGRDGTSGAIRSHFGVASDITQNYIGVRYARSFNSVGFNAFVVYNTGEVEELGGPAGPDIDNDGVLAKAQIKFPIGPLKIGVMGLIATGDGDDFASGKDNDAFVTPMSMMGLTGYWGYTGKLNVQGPTDAGIDSDNVNVDGAGANGGNVTNLGTGMISIQANASFNIIPDELDGYLGVGYFQAEDEVTGADDDIGFDLIAMGTYYFGSGMNLQFGIDYTALGEGHFGSVDLGPGLEEDREITLIFSRLQLEY
jgi:hypothetical protein